MGLVARMLERGSTEGLDTTCGAGFARPPFPVDP
jgi:hypothetical protein